MGVSQAQRAFLAWPVLVTQAKKGEVITYKQLGAAIGIHHRAVRFVLALIQDYCMEEKLPPLTILVINDSGKPGSGFIAWNDDFEDGVKNVSRYNWSDVENPFSFASNEESLKSLITSLVEAPDESEEVYAKVKTRGVAQPLFRAALLKAYRGKCAFTGLTFGAGLQAAHIIPWSKSAKAERLDIRNGVLLNSFHHSLFDQGYITMTLDHKIFFCDPEMKDSKYSEFDKLLTVDLHMKAMNLPKNREHWPLEDYIRRHYEISEWSELFEG